MLISLSWVFPAVNVRRDMTFAEDVRIGQYDSFIVPWHTHNVMPIILISFGLTVRFVRMKKEMV